MRITTRFGILILAVPSLALAAAQHDEDFAARCSAPGVVRCVSFDVPGEIPVDPVQYTDQPAPIGIQSGPGVPPAIDSGMAASGSGSLKFTIPSNSGANSGAFWANFADDFSVQFGQSSPHGKEFYVQWRQRFSRAFVATKFDNAGGFKQVIIGEGDRPNEGVSSCTDLEIALANVFQRGFPQMYHSCGTKDGRYEGLVEPYGTRDFLLQNGLRIAPDICLYSDHSGCLTYSPDQWMTFQIRIVIGTPYKNDGVYKHDSTIQLWVAPEGQPSTLVLDFRPLEPECQSQQTSIPACQTGYDLYNDDPLVRHYGQVWLLPYNTDKDPSQTHAEGYTWYDELIISKSRIADPRVRDPLKPMPPSELKAQ